MEPGWPDIVTAFATAAAVVFAAFAWWTSINTLRISYRPVVRAVPNRLVGTSEVFPGRFVLKNIGNGPAIGAMLFQKDIASTPTPLAAADLVEVLGDLPADRDETKRPGRWSCPFLTVKDFNKAPRTVSYIKTSPAVGMKRDYE